MRTLIIFIFLIMLNFAYAQDNAMNGAPTNVLGLMAGEEGTIVWNALDQSKISGVFYEFDDIRFAKVATEGSYLLFDDWKNKGVILFGGKKLIISNINFNVKSEEFMSQLENDSTFIFDFKGIDKIIVNDRPFKRVYNNQTSENMVCEVIFEGDNLALFKNYYITTVESSPNPMLNRPSNKIQKQSNYFISKNNIVSPFKLKKSDILELSDKSKGLEKYVKANRLSYKKEEDVAKMLDYLSKSK